ncbi:MAG: hypothetical protein P4L76_18085 [Beijerinckiaceae bacterium]|nr:hypothetical protein [Beijerinckiaceae bacterium]
MTVGRLQILLLGVALGGWWEGSGSVIFAAVAAIGILELMSIG